MRTMRPYKPWPSQPLLMLMVQEPAFADATEDEIRDYCLLATRLLLEKRRQYIKPDPETRESLSTNYVGVDLPLVKQVL